MLHPPLVFIEDQCASNSKRVIIHPTVRDPALREGLEATNTAAIIPYGVQGRQWLHDNAETCISRDEASSAASLPRIPAALPTNLKAAHFASFDERLEQSAQLETTIPFHRFGCRRCNSSISFLTVRGHRALDTLSLQRLHCVGYHLSRDVYALGIAAGKRAITRYGGCCF